VSSPYLAYSCLAVAMGTSNICRPLLVVLVVTIACTAGVAEGTAVWCTPPPVLSDVSEQGSTNSRQDSLGCKNRQNPPKIKAPVIVWSPSQSAPPLHIFDLCSHPDARSPCTYLEWLCPLACLVCTYPPPPTHTHTPHTPTHPSPARYCVRSQGSPN
jgi:hypothetical protein